MSVIGAYSYIHYGDVYMRDRHHNHHRIGGGYMFPLKSGGCANTWIERRNIQGKMIRRRCKDLRVEAMWPDLSGPSMVEMEPIDDSEHLDRILLHGQQNSQSIIIDWMASWCRKCIYLKPKLEKLASEYDNNKVKFHCVDVNKVPQSLVKRGNVSKMPTIQLWKDGEMKAEVIGGHRAWLVIEEVRQMIDKFV